MACRLVYPFERFTDEAKGVLTLAQQEAERSQQSYIGTEHLVIGLSRQDGLAARALVNLGQDVEGLREAVRRIVETEGAAVIQPMIPTAGVKRVIEVAFQEAQRQRSSNVGTDHMLLALLIEGEGIGGQVLLESGVTLSKARIELDRLRTAGVSEQLSGPPIREIRTRRHFEVADGQKRTIEVDLAFPSEYSDQECEALIDQVKALFQKR